MAEIHVRRQIREAFKAVLQGLPTTGDNVFTGRSSPLEATSELPGLIITAIDIGERSEVDSFGPTVKLARGVTIAVIGYDQGERIEDRLDQIALEVEQKVAADWDSAASTLRSLCRDVALAATVIGIEPSVKRSGEIRLSFAVEYRTTRTAPQTAV